jgi:hypothetical protein
MCRTYRVFTNVCLQTAQISYNKKKVLDMGRFSKIGHEVVIDWSIHITENIQCLLQPHCIQNYPETMVAVLVPYPGVLFFKSKRLFTMIIITHQSFRICHPCLFIKSFAKARVKSKHSWMHEIYFWVVSRAMYNQVTWNKEWKLCLLIFLNWRLWI